MWIFFSKDEDGGDPSRGGHEKLFGVSSNTHLCQENRRAFISSRRIGTHVVARGPRWKGNLPPTAAPPTPPSSSSTAPIRLSAAVPTKLAVASETRRTRCRRLRQQQINHILLPRFSSVFSWARSQETAIAFHHTLHALSPADASTHGSSAAAIMELVLPALNGPVVTTIAILFGTLVVTTMERLVARNAEIHKLTIAMVEGKVRLGPAPRAHVSTALLPGTTAIRRLCQGYPERLCAESSIRYEFAGAPSTRRVCPLAPRARC
jgi:hypothetical protein